MRSMTMDATPTPANHQNGLLIRAVSGLYLVSLLWCIPAASLASDPPHTNANACATCHLTHNAFGPLLLTNGVANLCLSCHSAGGEASAKPFASANQAWPWPGLPAATNASGTSHRWDAGAAGHVVFQGGAVTSSTGIIFPGGVYTGAYPKTYTVTITNAGNAGVARFNWTATLPGGGAGTNLLAATNTPLDQGILLTFANGTGVSFQVNDRWIIPVRPDLRAPTNTFMLTRLVNGSVVCSTCHDQHSQLKTPFDPAAPTNTTSAGRHFMRVANDQNQMCLDCHATRNVTNAIQGSHPVGISTLSNTLYKLPASLPLSKTINHVGCLTCHTPHYAPANNGMLLRMTNTLALCVDCHQLANTNTPGCHFITTNAATLWPGGQYGSLLTNRTDAALQGSCLNCHRVHGWPDAANPTNDYPRLLADREENLCFTCHDGNGPAAKDVYVAFTNVYHHTVLDAEQRPGRTVECLDCHNVHQSISNGHVYTNSATSTRNLVSNPLKGVPGVAITYSSLTNFSGVTTNLYTAIPQSTNEYQICMKCHSGYGYPVNTAGTASFTTNTSAVSGSGTQWSSNLMGQTLFRANDPTLYVITDVTSATSLSITPPYSGATAAGQSFTIMGLPPGLTPVYTNGTAAFTNNSTTVKGTSTTWGSGMIGLWIAPTSTPAVLYRITAVLNTTTLTIVPAYAGANSTGQRYHITGGTDLAQEFSPMNMSGHPIYTGLSNYVNTLAPRGLLAAALRPPWNANVGNQTMMCSDCHDDTTTNYVAGAAQGPHGSANQYILRGPNGNNWPNVTSFASSWCANCHIDNVGNEMHTRGEHTAANCYGCHIVIPHGGKVSRLIGNRNTMPARYAWANTLTNMQITAFKKTTANNYAEGSSGNCSAACSSTDKHPSISGAENW